MDQPIEKAMKRALLKSRLKQWVIIVPITILTIFVITVIVGVSAFKIGDHFATKQNKQLHQRLFLIHNIMQPNINIDSQITSDGSMFGGKIITHRSKDINGYIVHWSTLESSYNWLTHKIDQNELIAGSYKNGDVIYEYDKQTKQKVASFYHPDVMDYRDGVENKLLSLIEQEDYVAEVAISFKEPITFEELKQLIPESLNIVWFYMISEPNHVQSNLSIHGYQDKSMSEEGYKYFLSNLNTYYGSYMPPYLNDYITDNESKPFSEVEVFGVLLTGRTESFKPLANNEMIRGASIGATVPTVSFITPTK